MNLLRNKNLLAITLLISFSMFLVVLPIKLTIILVYALAGWTMGEWCYCISDYLTKHKFKL